MILYLIAIVFILLLGFLCFYKKNNDAKKKTFLVTSFIMLFIIMGFRNISVGTDTELYCNIFIKYQNMSFKEIIFNDTTSVFYAIYNKIVSLISTKPSAIIISNSFIICYLTYKFIKNNSNHMFLSVLFFILFYHYFSAMNIARQYIAVLIVANAIKYLEVKNVKKYCFICIVATMIHNTAIISLMVVPLFIYNDLSLNKSIFYFFIITTLCYFYNEIFVIFSKYFPHYSLYMNSGLLNEVGQNRKIVITLIYVIIEIIILIIIKKDNIKKNNRIKMFFVFNTFTILLGFLSLRVMLLSRIEVYFSIYAIIYIPEILNYFKDKLIFKLGFTIIMFIPMLLQLNSNNSEVLPYIFYK